MCVGALTFAQKSYSKFVCLLIFEYNRIFINNILTIKFLHWASGGLFTGVAMVTGPACSDGLLGI